MTRIIILFSVLVTALQATAMEIEKVQFSDTKSIGTKNFVLNGVGLRTKRKFGMNFKVYVAGLWLPKKGHEAEKLMEPGEKVLELVFLRSLDKDTMAEAWRESFKNNCQQDCDAGMAMVEEFNNLMVDVKDQSHLQMFFDNEGVTVEMTGKKENKKGRIQNAAFTRNLMAAFIGPKPPTEDLKKGLLGL